MTSITVYVVTTQYGDFDEVNGAFTETDRLASFLKYMLCHNDIMLSLDDSGDYTSDTWVTEWLDGDEISCNNAVKFIENEELVKNDWNRMYR